MAKKSVTIIIHRNELLYDIQDKTHQSSKIKEDARVADRVQSTDDESRLSLARRSLNAALSDMRAALSEFSPEGDLSSSNTLPPKDGDVSLVLSLPTNYNDGVTEGVTAALHRYVTNLSLYEWYTVTDPQAAPPYAAQAAVDMLDVRRLLLTRKRPERRICCVQPEVTPEEPEVTVSYLWLDAELWLDSDIWTEQ